MQQKQVVDKLIFLYVINNDTSVTLIKNSGTDADRVSVAVYDFLRNSHNGPFDQIIAE